MKHVMRALAICMALSAGSAARADLIAVALEYNYNGVVHAGEAGVPDEFYGYRSISDRGLDFSAGVPPHPVLDGYSIESQSFVLDIVHLGNRTTVDSGLQPFDFEPDDDERGIHPFWLEDANQSGPQTTCLPLPILLDATSTAGFIFQISNGGAAFDVRFEFTTGADFLAALSGPDWFGPLDGQPNIGTFPGTRWDSAEPSDSLLLTEGVIDLSAHAGRTLKKITFENSSNPNAGIAILAANVEGTLVPEPGTIALVGMGLVALIMRGRRQGT